ncbi:hypothetical protein HPP92_014481 [Vanilla planifolia]|uniref:Scarecrow-like protein 6 n=1 Tax=Vanilla planifolia TaxID=51239 RepID=A0A835QHG2_VANPL|nr:hypothetical protein HPP92_014481 [Vanilla planifolia]
MRSLPFTIQGKGALQVVESPVGAGLKEQGGTFWKVSGHKRKKGEALEPRSVLDQRRSPSPPTSTSTSTLSSSLGSGGPGSTDTAGVAAVSDNPALKWSGTGSTTTAAAAGEAGGRTDEWASELHLIPSTLEMGGRTSSREKCSVGVDDWETLLSESADSPSQEQAFLRWIMGDIDDPSSATKQLQQNLILSTQPSLMEFDPESAGLGFGLIEHGFEFEPIGSIAGGLPVSASPSAMGNASLVSSGGLSLVGSNNGKIDASTQVFQPQLAKIPNFCPQATAMSSLPMFYQEATEEKPLFFDSNLLINQQQQAHSSPTQAFFVSLPYFSSSPDVHHNPRPLLPQPKRHHSITADPIAVASASPEHFLRLRHPQSQPQPNRSITFPQLQPISFHLQQRPMRPKPSSAGDDAAVEAMALQQQQAVVDQLFKAAELIEAGNFIGAHGILARLNQHLPSPLGKPLLRSAFYFKEALQLLANSANPQATASAPLFHHRTPLTTPLDVVLKLGAYKAFSEVSPILQFTNFTATQALIEELGTAVCIHIIDFDIGFGGQWSSFMQELAQRQSPAIPPLKITAFVSPGAYHPLELRLTRDNLSHFALELNIPFEINIASIESFDPAEILVLSAGSNEVIAVNLPIGVCLGPNFSTILCLVKQLLPKIVVSVDQGCDRGNSPFSHHFLHALQSCMVLLDSIDAAGTDLEVSNKIEKFVLQPRIESCVIGNHCAAEKMLPWRTLFASAGFIPVQFSNFNETQAEYLLKRVQVRGFHVEKKQSSLYLYWQRGELASISAWRC